MLKLDLFAGRENVHIKYNEATDYTVLGRNTPELETLMSALDKENLVMTLLTEETFKSVEMEQNSVGETIISAELDDHNMNTLFDGAIDKLKQTYTEKGATSVVVLADGLKATYKISKDGYLLSNEMTGKIWISFILSGVVVTGNSNVTFLFRHCS